MPPVSRSGGSRRGDAVALAVACALVASCGSERPARSASGSELPAGAPAAVDSSARLAVGVVRGDTAREFHDVVDPFLLPDGRLVVPDAGSGTIRVFGPGGELVASLGGPGEGPGEFGRLNAAWARGDTIEAFDADLGRITLFPPGGEPTSVKLDVTAPAQGGVPGSLPDGGWTLTGVESVRLGARDTVAVHRYGPDGAHEGVVTHIAGIRRFRTERLGGPDPLSPRAVFAVHGGRVYAAETQTPEIRVLSPDGRLERTLTWDPGERPEPEEAFREAVDAAASRAGMSSDRYRKILEAFPVTGPVPAFWGFRVDALGFVWIEPFEPSRRSILSSAPLGPSEPVRWLILSPDGKRAGHVELPGRFEPTWIGRDAVVGVRWDSLAVQHVEVHALQRRAGGGA